jgi:hypothetical protein
MTRGASTVALLLPALMLSGCAAPWEWKTPDPYPEAPEEVEYEGTFHIVLGGDAGHFAAYGARSNCLQLRGNGSVLEGDVEVTWAATSDATERLELRWRADQLSGWQEINGTSPLSLRGFKGNFSDDRHASLSVQTLSDTEEPAEEQPVDVRLRLRYVGNPEPRAGSCFMASFQVTMNDSAEPRSAPP